MGARPESLVRHSTQGRGIGLRRWIGIRWRARRFEDPREWATYVAFSEMIASNTWDLAQNIDALNERYGDPGR